MEKWKKHFYLGKTSRRYILSFLSVLILPMICFIVLFQQNFRDIYREKVVEQAQSNLNVIGRDLDRKIESLHTLVEYNAIDKKLQNAVKQGEKGVKTVCDTLLATMVSYSFVEDVCYYNQASPKTVYSSTGTYTTYYYAKLKGSMESEQQLFDRLEEIRWAELVTLGTDLVYVVRDSNAAWWIFELDMLELRNLLILENAVTSLISMEEVILYEAGNPGISEYYEIHFTSSQNSFELIRRTEENDLFGELDDWQRNFVLMVIMILLAGGVLVLVLTYYNGKPLKKLLDYSREKIPDLSADMDGLEAFLFTLKSMEERTAYKAAKQNRDYLLLKLIYGQECDSDSFLKSLKEAELFENAQCYRVVMITSQGDQDINFNKIELYLNVQKRNDYEFHLIDLHSNDAVVMIVGMTEAADQGLKNELVLMAETIEDSIDGKLRFFVGEKGIMFSEIHRSYAQAYACRQRSAEREEIVNFYKSSENEGKAYQYPKAELGRLYDALIEADLNKSFAVTDKLITILAAQSKNQFVSVALYYDILNTYYRALVKLKKDEELYLAELDLLVMNESMDAVSMIYRIRDQYQEFVEREIDQEQKSRTVNHKGENQNKASAKEGKDVTLSDDDGEDRAKFIQRVITYIDGNIQSGDLNVSCVADYFGISISHMSHRFKEQTNRNISDYITEKKFSYACQLLKETDLSVKEITFITGYSHPYSFGRKFKQQYGMTPGEYREEIRNQGQRL